MLMMFMLFSAILCCVGASFGNKSVQFFLEYTKYLTDTHTYDTFIVYRPGDDGINFSNFEKLLHREFRTPLVTLNGKEQMRLCEFMSSNALAFIQMPHLGHFEPHVRDFGLAGRHGITMLFISTQMPTNRQELQSFFMWCWSLNILNAILLYEGGGDAVHVFSYSPFPTFHLRNLTGHPFKHYSVDKLRDLNGFVFNIRIYYDPPIVIGGNRRWLGGIAGLLFRAYVRSLNATYNIELERGNVEATRERNALLAPSRKLTHIGINTFTPAVTFAKGLTGSYPLFLTKVCVVVPVMPELPVSEYLPLIFQLLTPYFLIVLLVLIVLLYALLNCAQAPRYRRIEFGIFLSDITKSLLSQTVTKRATDSGAHKAIVLLVVALGFFWTNSFVATLTSLLSTLVPNKQIITVQDFLNSCYDIMVQEYDRLIYFESHLLPDALRSRLYVVDSWTMARHRADLNTSYAYVASSLKWNHINTRQRRLWRLRHTVASDELCSPILPESWPLQYDSPFEDSLKVFAMRAQSYGLIEKFEWISDSRMKVFFCDDYDSGVEPLKFEHLELAFKLLAALAFISCLCFIGELLLHRFKAKRTVWRHRITRL